MVFLRSHRAQDGVLDAADLPILAAAFELETAVHTQCWKRVKERVLVTPGAECVSWTSPKLVHWLID